MEMLLQIVQILFGGGTLIALVTFFVKRKQSRVEYALQLEKALQKITDGYNEVTADLVEVKQQNAELIVMVSELQADLESLRRAYERDTGKPAPGRKRAAQVVRRVPAAGKRLRELREQDAATDEQTASEDATDEA